MTNNRTSNRNNAGNNNSNSRYTRKVSSSYESKELAAYTTTGPCEYHRGTSLHIPGLSLIHDGGRVLYQPTPGISSSDLSLLHGHITGLIGTNGSGKSSTAQVLARMNDNVNDDSTVKGFPSSSNDNFVVEYLAASDDRSDGYINDEASLSSLSELQLYPREYIKARLAKRVETIREQIDKLELRLEEGDDQVGSIESIAEELSTLYDLEDQMENTIDKEIDIACERVGFNNNTKNTFVSKLSCGWRYKCRLIASMLCHPDMLLLDEPSFLDESSMDWLIECVKTMAYIDNCIVVITSHKEALLEQTCDRIVHINSGNQTLTQYPCGYTQFKLRHSIDISNASNELDSSQYHMEKAQRQLHQKQQQLQKNGTSLQNKYGTLKSKSSNVKNVGKNNSRKDINKQTRIHCGGAGFRIERAQQSEKAFASKLRRAQQSIKQDVKDNNKLKKTKRGRVLPGLKIDGIEATESTIVQLIDVGFTYNQCDDDDDNDNNSFVFRSVDACIESKDRILLKGPNGCGKSTLAELIVGHQTSNNNTNEPTEGSIRRNTNNILYFPQTVLRDLLRHHGHQSGIEFLLMKEDQGQDQDNYHNTNKENNNTSNKVTTKANVRVHLGRFGLENDLAIRPISTLSAGQRVRLWLAQQTFMKPNPSLLLLDEVSENVDIETRSSFVQLIQSFHGAVVVVSHDPTFCDQLLSLNQTVNMNKNQVSANSKRRTKAVLAGAAAINKLWTLGRNGIHISYPS